MNLSPDNPLFWFLVLAGLGLFLFGISSISRVIKKMADGGLSKIMDKCSGNRFTGFLTGAAFTAIIQSSGGTTALTIGMVRAGVLSFLAAAPIIIGANVGTTVTSFIISIPIAEYLSIAVLIGGFILLLATRKKYQNIGDLFFAIGCIFLGLWIMTANLKQLAEIEGFRQMISFLTSNPWLGLLLGALLTAATQSSSAVIGVVQSLYAASIAASIASGQPADISLFGVLPLLFGANIGTTITALLSSIGGTKDAKRAALFHFIYNFVGAALFMGLIYIPPIHNWLSSSATWGFSPALQIAFSHLIFNLVTAGIFLGALKPVCKLVDLMVPGSDRVAPALAIKELDSKIMASFPSQGIALGKEQVLTMFSYSKMMFETMGEYLEHGKAEDAEFVHTIEGSIDKIDRMINEYLLKVDRGDLSTADITNLTRVLRACKDIERIGDYGESLVTFFETASERKEPLEGKIKEAVLGANQNAITLIDKTIQAFKDNDRTLSLSIIKERRTLNAKIDDTIESFFDDIPTGENAARSYLDLVFVDIMNSYQRVYSHCSNIGKLYGTDKSYDFEMETKRENMTLRY